MSLRLRLERKIYAFHKWLGLVSGTVLVVIGLTGSLIVFRDEINGWQFPALAEVMPRPERVSLDRLLASARAARPDVTVYGIDLPRRAGMSSLAYWALGRHAGVIALDPHTSRVLGSVDAGESIADVLVTLHFTLLLSPGGDLVVALVAFSFLASGISGLFVYRRSVLRPFRRPLGWGCGARILSKRLHTLVGVSALAFNLLLGTTGAYMMLYAFSPANFSEAPEETSPPKSTLSADALVEAARKALPGLSPTGVYYPRAEGQPASVYGNLPGTPFWLGGDGGYGRSYVDFDPTTGVLVKAVDITQADPITRYETAVYELHFGRYGGLPVKVLYSLGGLTPGVLSLTGFILWWKRSRSGARTAHPPSVAAPGGRSPLLAASPFMDTQRDP